MKKNPLRLALIISTVLLLTLSHTSPALALNKKLIFRGGPAGGTFQLVANAIEAYPGIRALPSMSLTTQPSAGSLENLSQVNAGQADFSLVYSGHAYLGRNGLLPDDSNTYDKVLAVASMYGAPAQLVVRKGSGIHSLKDLKGKKVGVGSPGSGAFANCELFFKHLGLWDAIIPIHIGYNEVAMAFANKQLDAFWLFTSFPSSAVTMAAKTGKIDLLDLDAEARASGFYKKYPYFTARTLPPGTYRGVKHHTPSFQDSTLWVANAEVPDEVVYRLLSTIYSKKGLRYMRKQNRALKDMSTRSGAKDIIIPMHPGAVKFWKEKGLL
ncbi:TAXI family TRAP transporter solute-binding subunit [Thiovibrio frasassiensis]|uniref:TAXI family TRAP transporter solute-binding subunit n=1 Tax=Thiovibrio frasassiensis TaxID=2984131 RepID=A0A9X4MFJ0_9BACT|nr:TAXI family TRAP transporter solute-binding subunit [Thiovibrio frasassiensis]MDG4476311.1 TAXI family TRAP transporter solute-binding subunit [Thiovibrio frasassiensis]